MSPGNLQVLSRIEVLYIEYKHPESFKHIISGRLDKQEGLPNPLPLLPCPIHPSLIANPFPLLLLLSPIATRL